MPRIKVKCKRCGHEYSAGDFLPPSKSTCPKIFCRQKQNAELKPIFWQSVSECFRSKST